MSTTEDTSAIDEKKTEDTGTEPDFKGFASNYLSSIIFTIGIVVFIIGGLGLYTTKVAQANILPDNIELAPYTIIDRVVKDIPIDINVMRPTFWSENKDTFSQKAIFDSQGYLDSFQNSFLCSLKQKADPKDGANAALFFSRVYDNLVAKNLLIINKIFFYLSYLPESVIMFLYGLFGIFIWIGLYFFNMCISIFYHFVNIPELFRETNEDKNKWESDDNISYLRFSKFLLFCFIWIPVGLFSTFVMPIFFTIYGLFSPLFATYTIKGTKKSYGIYDFIKDTFAYKKLFFFILATLSLVSNGSTYLGSNAIIGILIAVAFAYYMGLYSNEMPEIGINGFTSGIKQNAKQASVIPLDKTQLVEICKHIAIDDTEMENIIDNGTFRKIISKETGGSPINADVPVINNDDPVINNDEPIINNDVPVINDKPITNQMSYIKYPEQQPEQPEQQPEQSGGKIRKPIKTKKYNFRLV